MVIFNVKLNLSLIVKILFVVIAICMITFFGISTYKIFSESIQVRDELNSPDVVNITAENYTNILKNVHDNLDNYIGQKIHFKGYVYRVSDFNNEEFVLARDMIISSDLRTLVVGFLCKYKEISSFEDRTWVEINGKITKGNYHGEIPVIEVIEIKKTEKPSDEYVYPPDSSYIPTAALF